MPQTSRFFCTHCHSVFNSKIRASYSRCTSISCEQSNVVKGPKFKNRVCVECCNKCQRNSSIAQPCAVSATTEIDRNDIKETISDPDFFQSYTRNKEIVFDDLFLQKLEDKGIQFSSKFVENVVDIYINLLELLSYLPHRSSLRRSLLHHLSEDFTLEAKIYNFVVKVALKRAKFI